MGYALRLYLSKFNGDWGGEPVIEWSHQFDLSELQVSDVDHVEQINEGVSDD